MVSKSPRSWWGQTRRRLGGRQPLCGVGVTSWMVPTSRPTARSERIAVSRPEPGPFTNTSIFFMPCSIARRPAASAAICAANGVDLREPLNPTVPALAHEITAPVGSVIVTMVLLNVLLMWASPTAMFFFSLRRTFLAPAACRLLGGIEQYSYESLLVCLSSSDAAHRARRGRPGGYTGAGPPCVVTCGPAAGRPRCAWVPCANARWCGCAGHGPGVPGGGGGPGSYRSRPCDGCRRRPHDEGHLRPGSWP